ncbi:MULTISPECIES: hypothetical protein [Nostoc]|uniref:Uncharacterized protein n=1 Tax=Nostoc paludosum FACHB-159 TaxID=2692908 RepID=A0ABR8KHH2_9NOSO|nr:MULTISPECIES: hypothetical protein [Nostoc]MBD2682660.1 hypothetical protein [Nostoc sp. FACHB-857]MBD2738994.1 hypothetical protein [Nostoc paludosum FACHB-159]
MSKYIIFKAESMSAQGWEERRLAHTEAYTSILAEHYDSSNSPIPEPGYRLREYHQVSKFADKQFPDSSTHSRIGDWEVTRVEEYTPEIPNHDFEAVIICYCRYSPVITPLEPMPEIQVSQELQEV